LWVLKAEIEGGGKGKIPFEEEDGGAFKAVASHPLPSAAYYTLN